jgi:hypothetical protein
MVWIIKYGLSGQLWFDMKPKTSSWPGLNVVSKLNRIEAGEVGTRNNTTAMTERWGNNASGSAREQLSLSLLFFHFSSWEK